MTRPSSGLTSRTTDGGATFGRHGPNQPDLDPPSPPATGRLAPWPHDRARHVAEVVARPSCRTTAPGTCVRQLDERAAVTLRARGVGVDRDLSDAADPRRQVEEQRRPRAAVLQASSAPKARSVSHRHALGRSSNTHNATSSANTHARIGDVIIAACRSPPPGSARSCGGLHGPERHDQYHRCHQDQQCHISALLGHPALGLDEGGTLVWVWGPRSRSGPAVTPR